MNSLKDSSARFDIEAMRGFAVVSVLLYHAGITIAPAGYAGVDVFFVLSGYLIIGLLQREWAGSHHIDLAKFWGRRARRLLPAASIVVVFTSFAAWLLSGRLIGREIRIDLVAAATYVSNLRFGVSGTDYWSARYTSPALHFWSLGVEEQFYIAAPLLIAGLGYAARRLQWLRRDDLLPYALSAVTVLSLAYNYWANTNAAVWNYYSPASRAWEFALGGLAAILPTRLMNFPVAARAFGWFTLFWFVITYSSTEVWPNISTFLPVLATMLLLRVGEGSASVGQVLARTRGYLWLPVAFLGSISYSAYLWHWPLLWIASAKQGLDRPEQLGATSSIPLILLALILAAVTKRFIEDPIRFHESLTSSTKRSLQVGAAASTIAVVLTGFTALLPAWTLLPAPNPTPSVKLEPIAVGQQWLNKAIAQLIPAVDKNATLATAKPALDALLADKPETYTTACHTDKDSTKLPQGCYFGDLKSETTVALFGDSHAEQYFGGLSDAAKALHLRLWVITKPSCPVIDGTIFLYHEQRAYPECVAFHKAAMAALLKQSPALVITSSYVTASLVDPDTGKLAKPQVGMRLWRSGYQSTVDTLVQAGIRVLVLRDVPNWGFDVADCLSTFELAQCAATAQLHPAADDLDIGKQTAGAEGIDLTNAICPDGHCWPIRANAIVVRDDTHISRTYSHVLAPLWQAILTRQVPVAN